MIYTPKEAAAELRWDGPEAPGDWTKVVRSFRDRHQESWLAADLAFGPYGPDKRLRMVVATTDPERLPDLTTWYMGQVRVWLDPWAFLWRCWLA